MPIDAAMGSPPKSAMLTWTQLIPAPNHPAPNSHPAKNGRCLSFITWRIASASAGIVKSHMLKGAKARVKLAPLSKRRRWGVNRFSIGVIWSWLIELLRQHRVSTHKIMLPYAETGVVRVTSLFEWRHWNLKLDKSALIRVSHFKLNVANGDFVIGFRHMTKRFQHNTANSVGFFFAKLGFKNR